MQVVITPEEGAETEAFGTERDGQEVVVGGVLLRFGENAEIGQLHLGPYGVGSEQPDADQACQASAVPPS